MRIGAMGKKGIDANIVAYMDRGREFMVYTMLLEATRYPGLSSH
jgi:hypothetical protein